MEQNTSLFGLGIDPVSKGHLSEAARWAKFLAICGFIMIGLMILYGIAMIMTFSQISDYEDGYNSSEVKAFANTFTVVVFVVSALLAFFPYLFLLRFANKMKRALESDDQSELNNSFMNLKILYRYVGILTLIGLAFMFLGTISLFLTAGSL